MNRTRIFTNKYYAFFVAIFCCILWGSAFPVLKISYEVLGMAANDLSGKIVFAGMRFFLASMLLFSIVYFIMKQNLYLNKKILRQLFVLGLLQTSLQYFFFYNGLANVTGMKGAILTSSDTFFVVLFAHYIYKDDKINLKKLIGLISGFIGIVLVNMGKGGFDLEFSFLGEGFLLLSALMSTFATFLAKRLSKDIHPFLITGWQMFMGSIMLILVGIWGLEPNSMTFTPKAWGLLFYASFLSATAFALWYSLLKYNKAGEISLYKFMIPISGSILSAIFLPKEGFTVYILLGLILVSGGIVTVNYQNSRSQRLENLINKLKGHKIKILRDE